MSSNFIHHRALLFLLLLTACDAEKRSAPLPHEAFVWQRAWTPEVSTAVRESVMRRLHVLAAELRLQDGKPVITSVTPDWSALRAFPGEVGAVIRIHASVGSTGWDAPACGAVAALVEEVREKFADGEVPLTEIQLDYDCPEKRLGDYARMLRTLKKGRPDLLKITALPSWLSREPVRELLELSPGYVLQLHSLHLPRGDQLTSLINVDEARKAIVRAAEIGVPFRVALPTYSCVVEFAQDGRVKEVHGEDLPSGLGLAGENLAVLDSDAYALADLVATWQARSPSLMQSIIWYRLPVSSDRLNWPAEVLAKVVRGGNLKRGWTVKLEPAADGQHEVILCQEGDAPDDLPREIAISNTEAADGVRGYIVQGQPPESIILRLEQPTRFGRVRPGEHIVIGWARFVGTPEAKILR